ncbi:metabolite traffic protein EboE [Pedobacter suwonensis]|uniref:metabolite traffic protein EboE n=1 Tax=Pedobacter suwonensis TaxID=332999 RepID=UPI001FD3F4D1|nr:metabolite traffic protein EboE [Pedobacter suwonensis]
MKLTSGHLTFCTNIYAGENWAAHFDVLTSSFPILKAKLSPDAPMGIGLRLSNLASIELLEGNHLETFKQWLAQEGGYVFTMNGFPYGGFHHTRVKDQVHAPDWTTAERVEYTLHLAEILSRLLPDDMEGGISTSPLSYKPWFNDMGARKSATFSATAHIIQVAEGLHRIFSQSSKVIHLDIEPEPDGFLESGREFIEWYENMLLPAVKDESLIKKHICLCYDVCHFAIGYEPHTAIIKELQQKGIKIGKIQISAALKAKLPSSEVERNAVLDQLARFDEPVYLHQVIAKKMMAV